MSWQRRSQTLWRHTSSRLISTTTAISQSLFCHVSTSSATFPHLLAADLSSHRPPCTQTGQRAPLSNLELLARLVPNSTETQASAISSGWWARVRQLEVCRRFQNSQTSLLHRDLRTLPRAFSGTTRCGGRLQTRGFRLMNSGTQEKFKYVVGAAAAFSLGYVGPSIVETALGQGMLATACGLGLLRFALMHPPVFSVVRRNFIIKRLARHVHFAMTSTNPSDLVHRSPAVLRIYLRLHEALALPHWIRDDTDSVRADLEKLCIEKVDRFNFEGGVLLGRALAMQEKNTEGDRVVEGVFAASARGDAAKLRPRGGELHLRADGNGSLPRIEEVTLWVEGEEAVQLVGSREVRFGQEVPAQAPQEA